MAHYTTFETPLGACAIAWSEHGICGLQPPEVDRAATCAALEARVPGVSRGDAPDFVREALRRIGLHLLGREQRFDDLPLDFSGAASFHVRIWQAARGIGWGRTASYGELAGLVGSPGAARASGQAMAGNRMPILVPCHRILGADHRAGGYSGYGGMRTKERMLAIEGVSLRRQPSLFRGRGVATDLRSAVLTLVEADPKLAAIIQSVGKCGLAAEGGVSTIFEGLAEAIVHQQLHLAAAAAILGRLRATLGGELTPERVLAAAKPSLRKAGLSEAKAVALRDLATRTLDGTVPDRAAIERLTDEALVGRLTQVRGIGRWTVEMLLIFRLGRPDVLPVQDLGLRRGFARMVGRKTAIPEQIARRGERWRPYRSIASWYLWRAADPG